MRETPLPSSSAPLATRTLAACVAGILELPVDAVPCPVDGDPWVALRGFLATRNLAPVPVRDPGAFEWAGWWIARLRDAQGVVAEPYVVMAGTPSGLVWAPAGTGTGGDGEVGEGWVLGRPWLTPHVDGSRTSGRVVGLFRAAASGAAMEALDDVRITPAGLEGDRYTTGSGHFSRPGRTGQALTLIEAEAVAALDVGLTLAAARRNVATEGIDLAALVGRRFTIGDVECFGQRLAEPCSWLQRVTPPGTLRGLVHRGGLRADVLGSGTLRIGDPVRLL